MAKIISFILIVLVLSLSDTDAASSCYTCNDCGTVWDITKVSVVQTSNANSYCRKTVTGNFVTRDFASSCTSLNILGHGIFCCQSDLCNSANHQSTQIINIGFFIAFLWIIYRSIY